MIPMVGRPEDFGLPKPNHKFFEAHPTQSVELPFRLGAGDVIPKPNVVTRLDGDTVYFEDGTHDDSISSSTPPDTTSPSRSLTPISSAPRYQMID